ncbi:MAG: hypothetical protein FWF54_03650 [Candidatus Azobacteroides sp.]|nr:hypothetical protein [Candidatus Azobacteroides sp.]
MEESIFKRDFRYSFLRNGVIELVSEHAPIGWEDNPVTFKRAANVDSLTSSYVSDFEFVKEARDYLKEIFENEYEKGMNPKVQLKIEQFDTSDFKYKFFYIGDVSFYEMEISKISAKFNVQNLNLESRINANTKTVFEYPLSELPTRSVFYGRLILENKAEIFVQTVDTKIAYEHIIKTFDLGIITDELPSGGFLIQNNIDKENKNNNNFFLQSLRIFTQSVNFDIKFNGDVRVRPHDYTHLYVQIMIVKPDNTSDYKTLWYGIWRNTSYEINGITYQNPVYPSTFPIEINYNESIDFNNEDKAYLIYDFLNSVPNDLVFVFYPILNLSGYMNLSYYARSERSRLIPAVKPSDLLRSVLTRLADDAVYDLDLSWLESNPLNNCLITSGDGIRGITDAKIKVSLDNLMKHLRSTIGMGYGYRMDEAGKQTFYVDLIDNFYKKDELLFELGRVKNLIVKSDANNIYSKVDVGYRDQNIDNLNGRYDIHSTVSFTTMGNDLDKKFDCVSPFIASCYAIEYLLLDYEKNPSTDSSNDNDCFIFHCNSDVVNGMVTLDRRIISAGHPAGDSLFNLGFTPKRNMLRCISIIRSFTSLSGNSLYFASSPKNENARTKEPGNHPYITEFDDLNNMGDYKEIFRMINYEFENQDAERLAAKLVTTGGYGYITFTDDDGNTRKAFVQEIGENVAVNMDQKYKLLKMIEDD